MASTLPFQRNKPNQKPIDSCFARLVAHVSHIVRLLELSQHSYTKRGSPRFPMPSIASIFSLGTERHSRAVRNTEAAVQPPDNFCQINPAFEISGFYSDDDEEDAKILPSQPYEALPPVSCSGGGVEENTSFSCQDELSSMEKNTPRSRKRSLTNIFKAKPEAVASARDIASRPSCSSFRGETLDELSSPSPSDKSSPESIASDRLNHVGGKLLNAHDLDNLPSSICQRLNFKFDEERRFYEEHILCGASLLSNSVPMPMFNSTHRWHGGPKHSCPTTNHLTQARKKLREKSINRPIIVGFQPRRTSITAQEKNECFQKIWIHQQNRIEAHQKMNCKFEVIPEEEDKEKEEGLGRHDN